MTSPTGTEKPGREDLAPLVARAIRAALAWAGTRGLPEHEMKSAALRGVLGALATHDPGRGPLAEHVRRRVRGALLDAARIERLRRTREALLDDMEAPLPSRVEDDEEALAQVAGVEAIVAGSPEDALVAHEARALLDRQVAKLSPLERRLYGLRFREGVTWEGMAVETGIPARTLRWHVARIQKQLTRALRALYDDAG